MNSTKTTTVLQNLTYSWVSSPTRLIPGVLDNLHRGRDVSIE